MTSTTGTWAVLPIKELHQAKQRLAGHVPPEFRAGLARAMIEDVLDALRGARGLDGVLVLTCDPDAEKLARQYGAEVSGEDARAGHTGVVASAAARLEERGCGTMLALPGDLPLLTSADVELTLAHRSGAPSVSLVPSLDGDGTNAVLASPPTALEFAFGPGSFARHRGLLRQKGIVPAIVRCPGIELDIDTPEDLALLLRSKGNNRSLRFCRENAAALAPEPIV